jgi:hypothetical protein
MKQNKRTRAARKVRRLVVPRFVYRISPFAPVECKTYEIGECDNPRSYNGWCDRRVCEGFWGNEQLCQQTVDAMNRHNIPLCAQHINNRN